jgi:hypothetical protein
MEPRADGDLITSPLAAQRPAETVLGTAPPGRRIATFLLEDLPDGGRRDLDPERGEFSVHPPTSPARVLPDQAQDESADGAGPWVDVQARLTGRYGHGAVS